MKIEISLDNFHKNTKLDSKYILSLYATNRREANLMANFLAEDKFLLINLIDFVNKRLKVFAKFNTKERNFLRIRITEYIFKNYPLDKRTFPFRLIYDLVQRHIFLEYLYREGICEEYQY